MPSVSPGGRVLWEITMFSGTSKKAQDGYFIQKIFQAATSKTWYSGYQPCKFQDHIAYMK